MTKFSYLVPAALALLYVTGASAQHPVLDSVANKVVSQNTSHPLASS
jgi:hypothetical protein